MNTKSNGLNIQISSKKDIFKKNEVITLFIKVINTGEIEASFCKYHTPFEGIHNDIFAIRYDDKEIPYTGIMKKRVPPTQKDFQTVFPGKEIECSVVLSGYDMKRKGKYTIQFSGNTISGLPSSNIVELEII